MLTRRVLLLGSAALVIAPSLPAWAQAEDWRQDPTAFINHFAERGITDILEADIDEAEKSARFRALFVDAFDIPAIARFVLGRYWRLTDEAQKQEFLSLFEDVIVLTWSRRFSEYDGQSLTINGTSADGETGTVVSSAIVDSSSQPIAVQWRLRKRDVGQQIVDVIVEGISMALTYQKDYASVIRQTGGIAGLIGELRSQVSNLSGR